MNTIEQKLVKASGKYVTTEHVDSLIRNYKKERWLQNSERIGKEDNVGFWLSIEELEAFIQTAKTYGADGIRLCFGVYGGDAQAPRPQMEGTQTMAFVATSGEMDNENDITPQEIYVRRNGKNDILAFNQLILPWPPTTTKTMLGSVMIADKEKGLQVI